MEIHRGWCRPGALLGLVIGPLLGTPTHSQTAPSEIDAIRLSLAEVVSLATLGGIAIGDQALEVSRRGADYQVRLPLNGFSAPAEAIVRPLPGGIWDFPSITLPSSGTFDTAMPNQGRTRIEFTIGEQKLSAQVDPGFAHPSTFAANFGAVSMHANQDDRHTRQTLDRYIAGGTVSAEQSGRLNFAQRANATNWHLTAQGSDDVAIDSLVRAVAVHLSADGVDRDQVTRLIAAAHVLMVTAQSTETETSDLSLQQRQALRAIVDALPGLLTQFLVDETLDGIQFSTGPDNRGSIERAYFEVTGKAVDDRLNAQAEVALDELSMPSLPAETAMLLPHHFVIKSGLDGVRTASLMALLRAATGPDADPDVLRGQLMSLFADPQAHIGIESVTFDCGPMQLAGSVKIKQVGNGDLGAAVHMSATGFDALIALAQHDPALQQILPMLMIARGKSHPDGSQTVWDFTFGL